MNDLPPDLLRLRTLETWLQLNLDRVRQQIAEAERREREYGERHRPAPPDWLLELGLNRDHAVYVHAGGCWNAGKRSKGVDRSTALRAFTEGIVACPHCRPDTELGILD